LGLRLLRKERAAAIAVRDTHVCISVRHAYFDGASWISLMEGFGHGQTQRQPQFPVPLDHQLHNFLSTGRKPMDYVSEMEKMSMIPWTSPRHVATEDDVHGDFLTAEFAPSEIKCYNAKTDKYVGLTDALWRAAILTAHAMKPQKWFGCSTWVNLRQFMKDNSIDCLLAPCAIVAKGASDGMTVGELEKRLRKDFIAKTKANHLLDGVKAMVDRMTNPQPPSSYFETSNVGYFPIAGLFLDACGQMTARARYLTESIGMS
jgi:hypothetical protein